MDGGEEATYEWTIDESLVLFPCTTVSTDCNKIVLSLGADVLWWGVAPGGVGVVSGVRSRTIVDLDGYWFSCGPETAKVSGDGRAWRTAAGVAASKIDGGIAENESS